MKTWPCQIKMGEIEINFATWNLSGSQRIGCKLMFFLLLESAFCGGILAPTLFTPNNQQWVGATFLLFACLPQT